MSDDLTPGPLFGTPAPDTSDDAAPTLVGAWMSPGLLTHDGVVPHDDRLPGDFGATGPGADDPDAGGPAETGLGSDEAPSASQPSPADPTAGESAAPEDAPAPENEPALEDGLVPGDDLESCAATLAVAVVLERGAPSAWRAVPVRQGLSSAVIDAVMTPRVMTSTVDAVVARHEAAFGAGTASELLHAFDLMGETTWREEIGTGHRTRASVDAPHKSAVIRQAAALLAGRGIESCADLVAAAHDDDLRRAWCVLPGQSSGSTWRHLLLAAGCDDVMLCPLTRSFARRATGHTLTADELHAVIVSAAVQLGITPAAIEHQMWRGALTAKRRRPSVRDDGAAREGADEPPAVDDQL